MLDALAPDDLATRLADPATRGDALREAAASGEPEAQALLGQWLLDRGEAREGFSLFNRAAAAGHLMALNMVGRCYDLGWGVAVDKVRAAECFRVAAARGLPEAMYNHATALSLGEGCAEDRLAALALFERAAAAGFAKAHNHVGSFAEDGWVHRQDMAEARRRYALAAEGGDFRGMFNHARTLAEDGDEAAALAWLERCGETATDAFVAKARGWLAACAWPRLRAEGPAALVRRRAC